MRGCLANVEIEAYLGSPRSGLILPAPERAGVEAHLGVCERCRKAVDEQRVEQGLLAEIRGAYEAETVAGRVPVRPAADARGQELPAEPPVAIEGYQIQANIHEGGQGIVFKAAQQSPPRTVAIKVLRRGAFASAQDRYRFEREVELVASLQHPNIVTVYDSGIARGHYYFAMEYIHGQPLDKYLLDHSLRLPELLSLFRKVCDAVSYAHQRAVIHRDLKPGNILVDAKGEPHIVDFGLAKTAGTTAPGGRSLLTIAGEFMGTLAYASPEQTTGDPTLIDVRSDVYSLGVILYEMLTGQFPYSVVGRMGEVLKAISEAEPQRPSTWRRKSGRTAASGTAAAPHRVNDELETIVMKCLRKERDRRYQSAGELARDVERLVNGEPIEAKRDSGWYVLRKLARRHLYASSVAALVLISVLSFGFIGIDQYRQARAALADRERTQAETGERLSEFSRMGKATLEQVRRMSLGWFLVAWQQNDLATARQLHDRSVVGTAEHAAMRYLLDDAAGEAEFLRGVPADAAALAQFIAGEKRLRAGQREAALDAFRRAAGEADDEWLMAVAHGRVRKLEAFGPERNEK